MIHVIVLMHMCLGGPVNLVAPADQPNLCSVYDLDGDEDVDLRDWADFIVENPSGQFED